MYQVWLGGDPAQGERTAQPTSIFKVLPQTPSPCGPPNAHPDPNPNPNQETEMLAPYLGGSEPTAKLDAAEKFLLDMCKVGR